MSGCRSQEQGVELVFCCCFVTNSVVPDSFATSWTVAHQACLSIGYPGRVGRYGYKRSVQEILELTDCVLTVSTSLSWL